VPQVLDALNASNANAGGNYLTVGSQSLDVRGIGLIRDLDDIENVIVSEQNGVPVFVKTLGRVSTGYKVRLGKVGIDEEDDVVEGVVLLMRGYQSLPVLERVKEKVAELNGGRLPEGMQIKTIYDRTKLIHTTIDTILHIVVTGILLVFATLYVFLGHFRTALVVALTVPVALLFTFVSMVMLGQSANLISLGAIDFGIIVDSTLLMMENVFFHLTQGRDERAPLHAHIVKAGAEVGRPIFFATVIIVIAFVPLFTMTGVPGRIFSPMSMTYGFALTGALMFAFTLAPVLSSWLLKGPLPDDETRIVRWIKRRYLGMLRWALDHERPVLVTAGVLLVLSLGLGTTLGGEFMPPLEEGNIWLRATMPIGVSFEEGSRLAADMRRVFLQYPEVRTAVSQLGRPDDGTDPTSFFNVELLVDLKDRSEWRSEIGRKSDLIAELDRTLSEQFPGVTLNFSQIIQDNVQEAMTGVKGENSVKIIGPDLNELERLAGEIKRILVSVRGIKDLGVLHSLGQPNLLIEVDRNATARYGLEVDDVNAVIQAAVGGQAVTQIFEGERWFDLVVRFLPQYRRDANTIGDIQVNTQNGSRIPLKQLATIKESIGPFMIYRENAQRYLPIKFSVRGRDLQTTVGEAMSRITRDVKLPDGYRLEWYGEYTQLQSETKRLQKIVPVSLLVVLLLVAYALHSFKDALLVLAAVPFALVGGIVALIVTHTSFSISAAVGFLSLFGVAIQGALVTISRMQECAAERMDLRTALLKTAEVRMRPVMMTALAAAIGLVPASISNGIGAQAQQPLARVVVGGMLSAMVLILLVIPVLYQWVHRKDWSAAPAPRTGV
jgi:cobalt-zinc-cadmium resistance protein CzcA